MLGVCQQTAGACYIDGHLVAVFGDLCRIVGGGDVQVGVHLFELSEHVFFRRYM